MHLIESVTSVKSSGFSRNCVQVTIRALCRERSIRRCKFSRSRVRNILLLAYEISCILCSFPLWDDEFISIILSHVLPLCNAVSLIFLTFTYIFMCFTKVLLAICIIYYYNKIVFILPAAFVPAGIPCFPGVYLKSRNLVYFFVFRYTLQRKGRVIV